MDTKIQVEIFGQSYQIRAGADQDYIRKVAEYVDQKMREIATGTPTIDSLKIAVLAALNITDELLQSRKSNEDADQEFKKRTQKIDEILSSIQ